MSRAGLSIPGTLAVGLLAGGLLAVAYGVVGAIAGAAGLLVLNIVVFPEMLDLAVRLYYQTVKLARGLGATPRPSVALPVPDLTPLQQRLHLKPYALVASVHNLGAEVFSFVEGLAPHLDRLWVIDDGSTDGTGDALRAAGCRCIAGSRNQRKPAAIRELLAQLPPEIQTVLVFDPDTTFLDSRAGGLSDLERVIFEFQQSRMAGVCPRIRVRGETWLSRLQRFEYSLSLLVGRKSLADFSINSGVSIYRRSALDAAARRHSLSVYAEDLEYSLLLLGSGERIYFDDRLVAETDGKRRWRGLFLQRVGWSYGYLKVYVERFAEIRRVARREPMAAYQYVVYLGVLGLLLHPLRLLVFGLLGLSFVTGLDTLAGTGLVPEAARTTPWLFLSSYAQYLVLASAGLFVAVPGPERRALLPIVPFYFFYAAFLTLPMTVGFLNWFTIRLWRRRLIADPYQTESSLLADLGALPEASHA